MNKQKGSAGIVALTIVAVIFSFTACVYTASHGKDIAQRVTAIEQELVTRAGSMSGPDIQSPYVSFNGIPSWYTRVIIRQASTTLCSIPTPPATSTLRKLTAHIASGNAYSNVFAFGYAANAYATTTIIGTPLTISGVYGDIVATSTLSTVAGASSDGIVYPNNFINFKVSSSSASATYAPIGDCEAEFLQL